jgi:hypothetical protein
MWHKIIYRQIGHFPFDVCRWSLNWPWSTKILLVGQFVTRMRKNWIWYIMLDNENYRSVWCQTHFDVTDKNNNISWTCWDTSNNVCLDLQNCCFSISIEVNKLATTIKSFTFIQSVVSRDIYVGTNL